MFLNDTSAVILEKCKVKHYELKNILEVNGISEVESEKMLADLRENIRQLEESLIILNKFQIKAEDLANNFIDPVKAKQTDVLLSALPELPHSAILSPTVAEIPKKNIYAAIAQNTAISCHSTVNEKVPKKNCGVIAQSALKHRNVVSKRANDQEKKIKRKAQFQNLELISNDEFYSIPETTRGRISLQQVNEVLNKLNALINEKYSVSERRLPIANSSEANRTWTEQTDRELDGRFFVAELELRTVLLSKEKLILKTILPCLRSLKRISTIRIKRDLFLVVCNQSL